MLMNLAIQPENLPAVDLVVLDAVLVEQAKSTSEMDQPLRGLGWSPMQAAYAEDH